MSDETRSRAVAPALAVAFVVVVLIAGDLLLGRNKSTGSRGGSGFQERAQQASIAFRMNFLPREQGERFRINLYDHGAGLAIGDHDNDSREDIYFLNQHGPNALYRNRGDRALRTSNCSTRDSDTKRRLTPPSPHDI
jgi:hypothetical protein